MKIKHKGLSTGPGSDKHSIHLAIIAIVIITSILLMCVFNTYWHLTTRQAECQVLAPNF